METQSGASSIARAHETYASLVEASIRDMILDGRLGPGDRINEVELAEAFEISRGPLREALQRLVSEGLVVVQKHRGAHVRRFDQSELADLYSLRAGLELWALTVGAEYATERQGQALSDLLASTRQILDAGDAAEYPPDLDFHRRLVSLSGSPALVDAHESVLRRIQVARRASGRSPQRARAAIEEHEGVLRALVDDRLDEASAALRSHIEASLASASVVVAATSDDARSTSTA
jgi:DNA-binding GntR family transcriptional regulator